MKIEINEINEVNFIALNGEIDLYNVNDIKDILNQLLTDEKYRVVLNLHEVPFIDSSGIVLFITYQKKFLEKNGNLKLMKVVGFVAKIFEQYSIESHLEIYYTEEEAIKSF